MPATSERMVAMALLGSPILFWHTRVEEENQGLEQGAVTYGGSVITQEIQQGRTVLLLSIIDLYMTECSSGTILEWKRRRSRKPMVKTRNCNMRRISDYKRDAARTTYHHATIDGRM